LLCVIGCLCFLHTRPYNKHKLQPRALPCLFLDYATSQKGYRCLHLPTNKLYISLHVTFDENSFPYKSQPSPASTEDSTSAHYQTPFNIIPDPNPLHSSSLSPSAQLPPESILLQGPTPSSPPHISTPSNSLSPIFPNPLPSSTHSPTQPPEPHLLNSTPPTQPPAPHTSSHPMITQTKDNTRRPRHFPDHIAFTVSLDAEPTTFTQANSDPLWRAAMADEINALAQNNTWTLIPSHLDQQVIGCKWVYRIKRHADDTIERYKARLVAKGYNQVEGIDYFDTFSPVVRPTTIRLVLSIAVFSGWPIRQLDVHNAFLNGDLSEQVLMRQPPGFIDPDHPAHVCLLTKAIYGLKQSSRIWFLKLSTTLASLAFHASAYDHSLFISHSASHHTYILIYVDDILITDSNQQHISLYISHLHNTFSLKDLGPLHYFLGIETTQTSQGLHISQTKYLKSLLIKTNMVAAKPCSTPMATNSSLSLLDSPSFEDPHLYRSIVGALQYATITRPDLSFTVNKVSQFMHNPTVNHWSAVKRILRYIHGTLSHGLTFHSNSSITLQAYSDADWAGSLDDRCSTSDYCLFLGQNLISWSAKKQPTVSRSSTEAEYRSLALTCAEILWIQYLLHELQIPLSSPPILWCDNLGATFLAANPMFHARTKHVEIDYHFVREKVAANELSIRFLSSKDQLADILTKPLPTPRFTFLRSKLAVVDPTTALTGV
jgi:Reverse transcriptase (RNA-dependent DNA polymerase)